MPALAHRGVSAAPCAQYISDLREIVEQYELTLLHPQPYCAQLRCYKPLTSSYKEGETPAKRVRAERHCGRCGEVGHNSRTCKVEIEDVDNSEESEE